VRETSLLPAQLIQPLFLLEGKARTEPIVSMPGQSRLSVDRAIAVARELAHLGVAGVALFPVLEEIKKDKLGSEGRRRDGFFARAITEIKSAVPGLVVVTDVALDPYSSDGHDGYLDESGLIRNDLTLELLQEMAVVQAEAGADWVAPSDMMDGRVGAIRAALDQNGHSDVSILSYTAKYASALYGPFRAALDSAPRSGDKKTYQMDPANLREAIRELRLDEREGADIVMVKPALSYLDVIREFHRRSRLPVAAYHVSGEYAMAKAAGQLGWLDADRAIDEALISIRRAGASMILTYAAQEWATRFHAGKLST
jgi:porphobilinogen synthase